MTASRLQEILEEQILILHGMLMEKNQTSWTAGNYCIEILKDASNVLGLLSVLETEGEQAFNNSFVQLFEKMMEDTIATFNTK